MDLKSKEAPLVDYDLELTYPLTVTNCLPMDLNFKLSKINYDMVREPDSFSRVALSKLGRISLTRR